MARAACADAPREWFFPANDDQPDARAVALCEHCEVAPECLTWAVATNSEGTWAATTTRQRRALRRRHRRRQCPVCNAADGVIEVGEYQVCVRCAVSWLAARAHPAASRKRGPSRPAE